ncbi:hypothetical protein HZC07_00990 [Candidatus Micrarchaeota archaeon]|nr:hypothetical protein [Candidatus Micrarchaeota archaeon]
MHDSIRDSLANADWETLAHALKTIQIEVDAKHPHAKRLKTKLGIVKILLYEKVRELKQDSPIELSFFIGAVKTINKMEKEFDDHSIKKREFVIFLKLLLYKFGKQKFTVKKPREILGEFRKMKRLVENGHSPLR